MESFDLFLKQLLKNPSKNTIIKIRGERKRIKGMAKFTSVNYKGEEYIKIMFTDHSHLLVIPSEQKLYFTEKPLVRAVGVSDEMIGRKNLKYKGKKYNLDNKNDYQFCLQLYVGKPNEDIEGECKFSDYISEDSSELLSLGWLSANNKRADVLVKKINLFDVSI